MLSVNKYTRSNMMYEELGATDVIIHMAVYWVKLVTRNKNKISNMIYSILYQLHNLDMI